jgi:polysaccharide export outer membrane protein
MQTSIVRMTRWASCIAIGLWLSTAGLAGSRSAQPQDEEGAAEYLIGPEDVLDIAVWNNTDISRTVPVRPDGKISLPLLNDVQAAGLTPMQLRDVLIKLLTSYIPAPTLSVIVREVHSFKVTVIGEVKTPGRYEIRSRSTVLDVLAMAGGLTQYAARDRIVVLRDEAGKARGVPFPLDKLPTKNGGKAGGQMNFCVSPGDIIMVP